MLEKEKIDDSIVKRRWNLPASFLGPLWLAYHKLYGASFFFFLISLGIALLFVLLLPSFFYIYIIFYFLFYLVTSNIIYKMSVQRKSRKSQKEKEADRNYDETSYYSLIGFGLLYFVIVGGVILILSFTIFKGYKQTASLTFNTSGFAMGNSDGSIFVKEEKNRTCFVQIGKLNETGQNLMYYYYGFEEDFSNMNIEKINGVKWYTNNREDREEQKTDIYLHRKGRDTYVIKFYGKEDKDYKLCKKDFDSLKKTVKI